VVFGAVLALVGIVGGVALVTVGFLADRGPQELGRAEFPGQVQFSSEDRVGRVGVYLERSTLSDVVGMPDYLPPVVTRDAGEVQVNATPDLERHAGVSSELLPIASFEVVTGNYTVSVDPDGTLDDRQFQIVVADPDSPATGTGLMVGGAVGGLVLVLAGAGVAIGVSRARDRARVRVLVQLRTEPVPGRSR
jgi:hypothetical protein